MKQRRFIMLDRDGTITVAHHYLSDPALVELIPGAAAALRALAEMKFGLVVITNQSPIGHGLFDTARLAQIHQRLRDLIAAERVNLDGIYFCPHTPEDDCACRKPRKGLVERAARELDFEPSAGFVIGDNACDIELGQEVGATTILVRTGYGADLEASGSVSPDYVVDDLRAAVPIIRRSPARQKVRAYA